MFVRWGNFVHRLRYTVLGVMVAGLAVLAAYGWDLPDHLSQSGFDDPTSQSAVASDLANETFGRDTEGDVIVLYTAPEGSTIDDPSFDAAITQNLDSLVADHPDRIAKINGSYFRTAGPRCSPALGTADKQHAIASIAIVGTNDTELTENFQAVQRRLLHRRCRCAGRRPTGGCRRASVDDDRRYPSHGSPRHPGRRGAVVLRLRRRRRCRTATDRRRADGHRSQRHRQAVHPRHRGQHVRRTGGVAGRAGLGDRLRPVHRLAFSRGTGRRAIDCPTRSVERS